MYQMLYTYFMVDDICQYTVPADYDLFARALDFNQSELRIWSREPSSERVALESSVAII